MDDEMTRLARSCGFDTVAALDVDTLRFLPEVRDMCAADRCQHYGKSWACPPACGSLELWRDRARTYRRGLLLQTVGPREDSFDLEGMMAVEAENGRHFRRLLAAIRENQMDALPMSAGTCTRCRTCTYPSAPCRFPEELYPSMEACGLFVSGLCRDNGVAYYYGEDRIAFTCCVLYNP